MNLFTGIGSGGANENSLFISGTGEESVGNINVLFRFMQSTVGAEIDQVGVTVFNAHDFDASLEKGGGSCRDDGVGRRGGTTGEQDGDSLEIVLLFGWWIECIGHDLWVPGCDFLPILGTHLILAKREKVALNRMSCHFSDKGVTEVASWNEWCRRPQ